MFVRVYSAAKVTVIDANPCAETVNDVEESARAVAQRFGLKGLE